MTTSCRIVGKTTWAALQTISSSPGAKVSLGRMIDNIASAEGRQTPRIMIGEVLNVLISISANRQPL